MKTGTRDQGPGTRNVKSLYESRVPSPESRIYLITDRCQTNARPLTDVVREALEGGIKAVQLREKDLCSRELFELASEMRQITSEYGAQLFINDRVDIALAVAADGVHIGAGSMPTAVVRRLIGLKRLIGYSSHSVEEARMAASYGADFITFGPVYQTPSKAAYGEPVGLCALKEACSTLNIPVFALGGVKRDKIAEVMAAAAHGVALISAVIAAPNPRTESALLLQTIEEHVIHS